MLTKLLYLENFSDFECEAKMNDILEENGRAAVILNQTVFYPQGGGQPYDKGVIESAAGKFAVEEVRFVEGIVKHIGKFESGSLKAGDMVHCLVDVERRKLHARIHSAGHLVDKAIAELKLNWVPGKGYHFPEGPYVEYAGNLADTDKDKLKSDLENLCNKFVQEGRETSVRFMDKNEMIKICHFVPDYIPEGKPGRVVMFGNFGVPCGGTHVKNLSEIKAMTIRKIKPEGANIRIGYDVEREIYEVQPSNIF